MNTSSLSCAQVTLMMKCSQSMVTMILSPENVVRFRVQSSSEETGSSSSSSSSVQGIARGSWGTGGPAGRSSPGCHWGDPWGPDVTLVTLVTLVWFIMIYRFFGGDELKDHLSVSVLKMFWKFRAKDRSSSNFLRWKRSAFTLRNRQCHCFLYLNNSEYEFFLSCKVQVFVMVSFLLS